MIPNEHKKRTISPQNLISPEAGQLSAEDKIAIHELIARNYLAEDTRDEDNLTSIVTEDYKQEHPLFGSTEGREGLASLLRENPGLFDGIRHQALNITTTGSGPDTAQAVHYILVTQVHAIDGGPKAPLPRIIGHGVVRDWLVKREGKWFVHRRVYDQMAIASDLLPTEQRDIASAPLFPDWAA